MAAYGIASRRCRVFTRAGLSPDNANDTAKSPNNSNRAVHQSAIVQHPQHGTIYHAASIRSWSSLPQNVTKLQPYSSKRILVINSRAQPRIKSLKDQGRCQEFLSRVSTNSGVWVDAGIPTTMTNSCSCIRFNPPRAYTRSGLKRMHKQELLMY